MSDEVPRLLCLEGEPGRGGTILCLGVPDVLECLRDDWPNARLVEARDQSSFHPLGAILAVRAPPSRAGLSRIAGARAMSPCLIAVARGSSRWSLTQKCSVLAAGAAAILDETSSDFRGALRAQLRRMIALHAESAGLADDLDRLLRQIGAVCASEALREVLARAVRMGRLPGLPVLIQGETGTGKEVVARLLHASDPKHKDGPFVALNSAAIPKELAESELFGHRRGAFSGATEHRRGALLAADGGVLFLDEVGELDPGVQAKLLRAIQERHVTPLGSDEPRAFDARILAATNRPLAQMVGQDRFRGDLLHRLATLRLELPPLRERREDIAPLARSFAAAALPGEPETILDPALIEALELLPLTGNARELRSIILEAVVSSGGTAPLMLGHLPRGLLERLAESTGHDNQAPESLGEPKEQDLVLSRWMAARERELLSGVLRRTNGNQTRAARVLGVTPRCVYQKLRKHGLLSTPAREPGTFVPPGTPRPERSRGRE